MIEFLIFFRSFGDGIELPHVGVLVMCVDLKCVRIDSSIGKFYARGSAVRADRCSNYAAAKLLTTYY